MTEAVIVSTARTALTKSFRGSFNDTEAPVLGGHVVRAVVERAGIEPGAVEDVIMGAAVQQGTQAYNIGRLCAYTGGLPQSVAGMAVDGRGVVLPLAVEAGADAAHLVGTGGMDGLRGLLLRMDAESAEEVGEAYHAAAGLLEAREDVPI